MRSSYTAFLIFACTALLTAQTRPKDVREIAKGGTSAIPKLQELLKDPGTDVRVEVVKQLTEIGTAIQPRPADPGDPR